MNLPCYCLRQALDRSAMGADRQGLMDATAIWECTNDSHYGRHSTLGGGGSLCGQDSPCGKDSPCGLQSPYGPFVRMDRIVLADIGSVAVMLRGVGSGDLQKFFQIITCFSARAEGLGSIWIYTPHPLPPVFTLTTTLPKGQLRSRVQ